METNCDLGKVLGGISTIILERLQFATAEALQEGILGSSFNGLVILKQSDGNDCQFNAVSLIILLIGFFLGYLTPFFCKVFENIVNCFQIPICDLSDKEKYENKVMLNESCGNFSGNNSGSPRSILALPDSPLAIKAESTEQKILNSSEVGPPGDKSASAGKAPHKSSIEDDSSGLNPSKSQKSNGFEGQNSSEEDIVRINNATSLFDFQIANKNTPKSQFREAIILHQNEAQVDKRETGFRTRIVEQDDVIIKIEIETRQITYQKDAANKLKEAIQQLRDFGNPDHTEFTKRGCLALEEPNNEESSKLKMQIVPKEGDEEVKKLGAYARRGPLQKTKEMYPPIISPVTIPIPFDTEKEFPHLNGFFQNVFGKKERIGKGGFGEVYKALHKLEQKFYAIKKIKLLLKHDQDIRQNKFFREVAAMTSLNHKNVVRHHTTWTEQPEIKAALLPAAKQEFAVKKKKAVEQHYDLTNESDMGFEWEVESKSKDKRDGKAKQVELSEESKSQGSSQNSLEDSRDSLAHGRGQLVQYKGAVAPNKLIELHIQMEYCSGKSLSSHLKARKKPPKRKEMLELFNQILEGVAFIHSKGIMHRDLKPSNIFLENKTIKIGDFGLSWLNDSVAEEEVKISEFRGANYTSNIGTPLYVSPEQEISNKYDYKTDVFSLGMIFFEMLNNFSTEHERVIKMKDFRNKKIIPPEMVEKFPKESQLMLRMIDNNPKARPSASEALTETESIANKI